MKRFTIPFSILALLIIFTNCNNDDDGPSNLPPTDFGLNPVTLLIYCGLEPFTWDESTDPEGEDISYTIILDTNPEPSTIIAENLNTNSYTLDFNLANNTIFYWKVIATDGVNRTESAIKSFENTGCI